MADLGLRPDARLFFSNDHLSHALPSLFFTDWEEALLYTADGSGDQVYYSHYLFQDGKLATSMATIAGWAAPIPRAALASPTVP